jgi:hypothetical protein
MSLRPQSWRLAERGGAPGAIRKPVPNARPATETRPTALASSAARFTNHGWSPSDVLRTRSIMAITDLLGPRYFRLINADLLRGVPSPARSTAVWLVLALIAIRHAKFNAA